MNFAKKQPVKKQEQSSVVNKLIIEEKSAHTTNLENEKSILLEDQKINLSDFTVSVIELLGDLTTEFYTLGHIIILFKSDDRRTYSEILIYHELLRVYTVCNQFLDLIGIKFTTRLIDDIEKSIEGRDNIPSYDYEKSIEPKDILLDLGEEEETISQLTSIKNEKQNIKSDILKDDFKLFKRHLLAKIAILLKHDKDLCLFLRRKSNFDFGLKKLEILKDSIENITEIYKDPENVKRSGKGLKEGVSFVAETAGKILGNLS